MSKKIFINFLIICLVVLLQTSLFPHLSIFSVSFNLIILIVISLVFLHKSLSALIWVLFGGLLIDLISGSPIGFSTIGLAAVFLGLYFLIHNILAAENIYIILAFSFGAVVVYNTIQLLLVNASGGDIGVFDGLKFIVAGGIANSVLMLFVYPTIFWFDDKFLTKQQRVGV